MSDKRDADRLRDCCVLEIRDKVIHLLKDHHSRWETTDCGVTLGAISVCTKTGTITVAGTKYEKYKQRCRVKRLARLVQAQLHAAAVTRAVSKAHEACE